MVTKWNTTDGNHWSEDSGFRQRYNKILYDMVEGKISVSQGNFQLTSMEKEAKEHNEELEKKFAS